MSIWKDKKRGEWVYQFQCKKQGYGERGFSNRREASIAMAARRKAISLGIGDKTKQIKTSILSDDVKTRYDALKIKYENYLNTTDITLADLFDEIMIDFGLPYSFKDVSAIVKNYNKKEIKIPSRLRIKIFERDNYSCQACGRKPPEVILHADHKIPVSRGGLTEERNLRTLCMDCNLGKSNMIVK